MQWPVLIARLATTASNRRLNTVVHHRGFTGHADRDARRARLQAEPAWQAYWAQARARWWSPSTRCSRPPLFATPLARIRDAAAPAL